MTDPTRGVLRPDLLPRFTRIPPPAEAADLVAWFWVPQWDLPDGVESRQGVLGYPAANLVVEAGEAVLWGPTSRASERVLRGRGWAVGALLRPPALARLSAAPADLVDGSMRVEAAELVASVAAAMPEPAAAAAAMASWLRAEVGEPPAEMRLAGVMADLLMTDASVFDVETAAARLRISVRTLQRLAHRTVGVSPAAMIRRRRLQEAAQRLREDPAASLSATAAELGYADQAHLARDFRAVLGMTASEYRGAPTRRQPLDRGRDG